LEVAIAERTCKTSWIGLSGGAWPSSTAVVSSGGGGGSRPVTLSLWRLSSSGQLIAWARSRALIVGETASALSTLASRSFWRFFAGSLISGTTRSRM
jgi:hypothetical protein